MHISLDLRSLRTHLPFLLVLILSPDVLSMLCIYINAGSDVPDSAPVHSRGLRKDRVQELLAATRSL